MEHSFNHELLASLAAHEEFVRRVARRLVAEDQTVEDVAQDVWLAAASAPSTPHATDTRGFLAGIVRNVVLKKLRGEARRVQRQRIASKPESTPATDDLVIAEEWRRKIVDCVLRLPELEREVIVQRFLEGNAPRLIAAHLEVPVETVKSRLKRALTRLRNELGSEGDANELVHGLALAAAAPGVAGKSGLLYKVGAYGMKTATKWKVAGLLSLLAVSLFVVQIGDREAQDERERLTRAHLSEPSRPAANPSRAITHPESRLDAARSKTTLEANSPLKPSLHGVLRSRTAASPVEGASLELEFASCARETLTTAADGGFEFTTKERRRLAAISIPATSAFAASRKPVHWNLGPGEAHEIDLMVSNGATLSGVVLDAQDQPVGGALVQAWCAAAKAPTGERPADRATRTNANGEFTLKHLGEWVLLEASSASFSPTDSVRGFVSEGDRLHDLVLRVASSPGHRVQVVSESGVPIAGATVGLNPNASILGGLTRWEELYIVAPRSASHQSLTDSNGLCVSETLPIGQSLATVEAAGFLPWKGPILVEREVSETRVVLHRGFGLSGRVVSPRGEPISGALVRLRTYEGFGDRGHDVRPPSRTDAKGRYAFESVPTNHTHWISVDAHGYSILPRRSPPLGLEEIKGHILQLKKELRITGRLVDAAGLAIPNARISIAGVRPFDEEFANFNLSPSWKGLLKRPETRTSPSGAFEFTALPSGTFRLTVRWFDSTERAQFFEVVAGSDSVKLTLTPDSFGDLTFTGRVLDALTGEAIPRFSIVVIGQGEQVREYNSLPFHFDAPDGRFAIGGQPPIESSLFVKAHGYRDQAEPIRPRAPGEHVEEVRLQPARSLSLRFIDQHDVPVEGYLMVQDSLGQPMWVPNGRGSWAQGQRANKDGRAILQNMPAEKVRLLFYPPRDSRHPDEPRPAVEFEFDLLNPSSELRELRIELPE